MIQSPIQACPSAMRAVPAQAEARSQAPGNGFEDLLGDAVGAEVEAAAEGVPAPEPEGEIETCDQGGDPGCPAAAPEQVPLPIGLAAAVPDLADAAEEGGATDVDGAVLVRLRAAPGTVPGPAPATGESVAPSPDLPSAEMAAGRVGPDEAIHDTGKPLTMPEIQAPPPTVAPASVAAAAPPPPARAAPSPAPVPRQVADAVLRMAGDVTEITLAPAELGQLRITLSREPQGLVVLLSAERPEALELLRRHMDLLRQELAAQGEEGARLDFTAPGQGEGFASPGGRAARPGAAALPGGRPDIPIPVETVIRPTVPGRIDMRI